MGRNDGLAKVICKTVEQSFLQNLSQHKLRLRFCKLFEKESADFVDWSLIKAVPTGEGFCGIRFRGREGKIRRRWGCFASREF